MEVEGGPKETSLLLLLFLGVGVSLSLLLLLLLNLEAFLCSLPLL